MAPFQGPFFLINSIRGLADKTLLPDEDSNLDKQNQNLSYYLYTIGQFSNRPQK